MSKLITIHSGDLHLTDLKPKARVDEEDWLGVSLIDFACRRARIIEFHRVPELLSANSPVGVPNAEGRIGREENGQVAYRVFQVYALNHHHALIAVCVWQLRQRVVTTLVGCKEVQPLVTGIEAHLLHRGILQRRIAL